MSYRPFSIEELDLTHLSLDLENYRIPSKCQSETEAFEYLFNSEEAITLAKSILREGYFDNEVPIVMQSEDGLSYIVLEGNRRVSALKALHNPELVVQKRNEIENLRKRYGIEMQNLPSAIRVLVVGNREEAAPHIARLHTKVSKKSWSRDQQATFYFSLLSDTVTVDDIKSQYPSVDVVRFIKMAVMRRFLQAIDFPDQHLNEYVSGDSLKMSVFEYAYRINEVLEIIGVRFENDGLLFPKSKSIEQVARSISESQLRAISWLIEQFYNKRLNTRSPEFKKSGKSRPEFLSELRGSAGGGSPTGTGRTMGGKHVNENATPAGGVSDAVRSSGENNVLISTGNEGGGTRGPNSPETKTKLDLAGVRYDKLPVNIKYRYLELRKLNLNENPIAASMLMRNVLEITIKAYFQSISKPVQGELGKVMRDVEEKFGSIKSIKSTINKIRSGKVDVEGSVQWFNIVSHAESIQINSRNVHKAWMQIQPLISYLIDEYKTH